MTKGFADYLGHSSVEPGVQGGRTVRQGSPGLTAGSGEPVRKNSPIDDILFKLAWAKDGVWSARLTPDECAVLLLYLEDLKARRGADD